MGNSKDERNNYYSMVSKNLIKFASLLLLIVSCVNINVFEKNLAIDNAAWPSEKIYRFEYLSNDTVSSKNVYINMRHNSLYKYNNIFLFVTTIAPNGKNFKDTVEFTIADNKGKWLGAGLGDIHDLRLTYKQNIRFAQQGKYVFYIQQGMREKILENITDIGLRIDNAGQ